MFAAKAKIYGVLYKRSSSIAFDETSSYMYGQRLKTHKFSAFHWSPRGSLVSIGQHFVATRVVHLPKSTETSLITKADLITSYCSYARPAQPGPIRTRLCGPCIAVIAGCFTNSSFVCGFPNNITKGWALNGTQRSVPCS